MNKVLSIEIAGQVFWIEEDAFDVLETYLKKLKQQLAEDECNAEIIRDIELRLAELLFNFHSDDKNSITLEQVEDVIQQVGFIDSEFSDEEIARKSFLDPQNKIVGGVCSGLALRFQVPAIILRLIFIALIPLFGFGIVLYLIFWVSLDSISNRSSALAALGRPLTAKHLALFEEKNEQPVRSFFHSLQSILFLPFSILGALLLVILTHLKTRSSTYKSIFLNIVAAALLFLTGFSLVLLWEFNKGQLFPTVINWVLSLALVYLVVLGVAIFAREYYLSRPYFRIRRELKLGALVPLAMFVVAFLYLSSVSYYREYEIIERSFPVFGGELNLAFNEEIGDEGYHNHPRIRIKTKASRDNTLSVTLTYGAAGGSTEKAESAIQAIDYNINLVGNTLQLDNFFLLKDGAYYRSQSVSLVLEVPQNILLNTDRPLVIRQTDGNYDYNLFNRDNEGSSYLASGDFLHETDESFKNRLSNNERTVLRDKFCQEFFIGESWNCNSNVLTPIERSSRFDRAFQNDAEIVDEIRNYFLPNRSLLVSNLLEVNNLVESLSINYPVMSDFQEYITHLIEVKSI